jgi:molecular chaperone DnaK (HSP70)
MAIAMDFGTCNTVFARWNVAARRADLVHIPGLSRQFKYRLPGHSEDSVANVVPTLIHYGEGGRRLLGDQVATEGLVDHPGTFRWVKLDLLRGSNRKRRVNGSLRSPVEAATQYVQDTLTFALGALGGQGEELVITVPVEAYDQYVDWLRTTAESVAGTRRVRMLDEATACILGYQETVRNDEVYAILDFCGGTLDVSLVRVNLGAEGLQKCLIRGRAGEELGGMLVDQWMLARLKEAERLTDEDVREVGTPLLRAIEEAKIVLSNGAPKTDVTQLNDLTGRLVSHTFAADGLRGLLERHEFTKLVARTVDRALDAASGKYGVRKRDIRRVFLVGGTSLLLGVREFVSNLFPDTPVQCHEPFAAIAAGACRYAGQNFDPTLVHTYELKSWNPDLKDFDQVPIIEKGTQYPTRNPSDPASHAFKGKYICAAADQAHFLNLVFYELSDMVRPGSIFVLGPDGRMQEQAGEAQRVQRRRALNPDAEDFIQPNPPCDREETKRFVVGFGVDENKRLTVSVKDTRPGNRSKIKGTDGRLLDLPVRDYPLVRL